MGFTCLRFSLGKELMSYKLSVQSAICDEMKHERKDKALLTLQYTIINLLGEMFIEL